MYDENFKFLVNYYNNDNGIDLPAEPDELRFPYRAICANIAWCMVNKDRFWEYYNKSEFWRVKLMSGLRHFSAKYFALGDKDEVFLEKYRNIIINNFTRKFILTPHKLESGVDISTIYDILYQADKGIY